MVKILFEEVRFNTSFGEEEEERKKERKKKKKKERKKKKKKERKKEEEEETETRMTASVQKQDPNTQKKVKATLI